MADGGRKPLRRLLEAFSPCPSRSNRSSGRLLPIGAAPRYSTSETVLPVHQSAAQLGDPKRTRPQSRALVFRVETRRGRLAKRSVAGLFGTCFDEAIRISRSAVP